MKPLGPYELGFLHGYEMREKNMDFDEWLERAEKNKSDPYGHQYWHGLINGRNVFDFSRGEIVKLSK